MALSILYLGINYDIESCNTEDDLPKLAYLLGHGTWALNELGGIAKAKVELLRFVDEIEVYLAYPIKLKERLKIPIRVEEMLYFGCSSVTEDDLQQAEVVVSQMLSNEGTYFQILAKDNTWEKALATHKSEAYNEIKEAREQATLGENPNYDEINRKYVAGFEELTRKILHSHFPFG